MHTDYYFGKDWVDVSDGSVTREHVRKWRILQDLKVRALSASHKNNCLHRSATLDLLAQLHAVAHSMAIHGNPGDYSAKIASFSNLNRLGHTPEFLEPRSQAHIIIG